MRARLIAAIGTFGRRKYRPCRLRQPALERNCAGQMNILRGKLSANPVRTQSSRVAPVAWALFALSCRVADQTVCAQPRPQNVHQRQNAAPSRAQIERDLRWMVGGQFSSERLGATAYEALAARATANAASYLDALERAYLRGADSVPSPELMLPLCLEFLMASAPERTRSLAQALGSRYEHSLRTPSEQSDSLAQRSRELAYVLSQFAKPTPGVALEDVMPVGVRFEQSPLGSNLISPTVCNCGQTVFCTASLDHASALRVEVQHDPATFGMCTACQASTGWCPLPDLAAGRSVPIYVNGLFVKARTTEPTGLDQSRGRFPTETFLDVRTAARCDRFVRPRPGQRDVQLRGLPTEARQTVLAVREAALARNTEALQCLMTDDYGSRAGIANTDLSMSDPRTWRRLERTLARGCAPSRVVDSLVECPPDATRYNIDVATFTLRDGRWRLDRFFHHAGL